jgi:hypothetical protein
MDYRISLGPDGIAHLLWEKNIDIRSNIWILMNINKGDFFLLPWLGNELYRIKKLTDQSINQAKVYIQQALQPIIECGRATSINVICEKDKQGMNRLNYKITATQPDGLIISYESFTRVY